MKIRCQPEFEFKCPKEWDKLDGEILTFSVPELASNESRFCHECQKNVYRIYTLEELDFAAKNKHCVVFIFEMRNHEGMNLDALPYDSKPILVLLKNVD
jgi:hypothetical protein